jgi:hypothetical protein
MRVPAGLIADRLGRGLSARSRRGEKSRGLRENLLKSHAPAPRMEA